MSEMITWLYVRDLARSQAFYRQGLGLRPVLQQGDCCILAWTDTAMLGLCQRPPPHETPGLLLCFVEEDVSGRVEALVSAGAVLEQEARANPRYGIFHAFLRDPDGHRIEVQRFDDPNWRCQAAPD